MRGTQVAITGGRQHALGFAFEPRRRADAVADREHGQGNKSGEAAKPGQPPRTPLRSAPVAAQCFTGARRPAQLGSLFEASNGASMQARGSMARNSSVVTARRRSQHRQPIISPALISGTLSSAPGPRAASGRVPGRCAVAPREAADRLSTHSGRWLPAWPVVSAWRKSLALTRPSGMRQGKEIDARTRSEPEADALESRGCRPIRCTAHWPPVRAAVSREWRLQLQQTGDALLRRFGDTRVLAGAKQQPRWHFPPDQPAASSLIVVFLPHPGSRTAVPFRCVRMARTRGTVFFQPTAY
jgi:hypothetical protein